MEKPFRILSIDGGGIRGIIPAKVLAELEAQLKTNGSNKAIYEHFDLICGTSTGALLAIGLALGIPAQDLLNFYKTNARVIFPTRVLKLLPQKSRMFFTSVYGNKAFRNKLIEVYSSANHGVAPLLNDLKTRVCIPVFNGGTGKINVLKTKHHPDYSRDYKLPAHEVALSSASAPVYFPPHSFSYTNIFGSGNNVSMIDGGVFANNPVLVGVLEAHEKLNVPFNKIQVISLGTGQGSHIIKNSWKTPSIWYWLLSKPRLLDIILDSQAQITEQYLLFLKRGLESANNGFDYLRIQYDFGGSFIDLSSSKRNDLDRLEAIGGELAKIHLKELVTKLF